MNGFTRKKVETLTLGERLRKMRNDRRVSVAELSRITGIRVRYLEALEAGDYKDLPPNVYVRGFIRSYASAFDADVDMFLRLYERERGMEKNIRGDTGTSGKPAPFLDGGGPAFVLTPRSVVIVSLVLVFFASFLYLYTKFRDFDSEPRLVIREPASGMSVALQKIMVVGTADRDGKVSINGHKILVDENGNFSEEVALSKGPNTIRVSAMNRFEKETTREIVVNSSFGEGVQESVSDGKTLKIRSEGGSTLVLVKDGQDEVWSGTMGDGVEKIFTVKGEPEVLAGIGSVVYVSIDGGEERPVAASAEAFKGRTTE
jgi:transcriptional regulator with XRE-family HTH domain